MYEMPVGYEASRRDYLGLSGEPYSLKIWNSLTFGEQERYAIQEMKEMGVEIDLSVSENIIYARINTAKYGNLSEKDLNTFKFEIKRAALRAAAICQRAKEFGI